MGIFGFGKKSTIPTATEALPGRAEAMKVPAKHYVNGNPLKPPFPEGMETAVFGMGCFWGAERKFGSRKACLQRLRAMLRVQRQIPPITRFALA